MGGSQLSSAEPGFYSYCKDNKRHWALLPTPMEIFSWKHSKAYHTISFPFSPVGRFLILEWKTGSRETCGSLVVAI